MLQKKILILTASPDNEAKLRADKEIKAIEEELNRSRNRDKFKITLKLAVNPDDLIRVLRDEEPTIVHFCGHAKTTGLVFENEAGAAQLVSAESLVRLFKQFKDKVECVLLNACYTDEQAAAINQHIQYVIGMTDQAEDTAAIKFATNFYAALIAGRSYKDAFEFGCIALDLLGIQGDLLPKFLEKIPPSVSPTSLSSRVPVNPPTPVHYASVINAFKDGDIIPFLGAGVNLFDGQASHQRISDIELADYLAQDLGYEDLVGSPCPVCLVGTKDLPAGCPVKEALLKGTTTACPLANDQALAVAKLNLQCLAQYVKLTSNIESVYKKLHELFQGRYYSTNKLHKFFANLPREMREKGYPSPYKVLITTNYDEMIEDAFAEAHEPFDLLFYVAEGEENQQGRFQYRPYHESIQPITPDTEVIRDRPVILKLYGVLENFVITEEHHINYLIYREIDQLLPSDLLQILHDSKLLLMGYSPSDLDLRLIVNRFWREKAFEKESWMIHQAKPGELDKSFWNKRNLSLVESDLEEYLTELERKIRSLEPKQSPYAHWSSR